MMERGFRPLQSILGRFLGRPDVTLDADVKLTPISPPGGFSIFHVNSVQRISIHDPSLKRSSEYDALKIDVRVFIFLHLPLSF